MSRKYSVKMDNARQQLGQGFKSVCHPLWRPDALTENKKKSFT